MKSKLFLLMILALALPLAAFADTESFTSVGGTFTGDSGGYVLTNATLTSFTDASGTTFSGSNLGTLSLQTNTLGSVSNVIFGGPFVPGGSITVTGNGTGGVANGLIFTGTFSQGGTWSEVQMPDSTFQYTLSGIVDGNAAGNSSSGSFQFVINNGVNLFGGTTKGSGTSDTNLAVPEPGELSLLGAGILGLAGVIRRKFKVQA